MKLYLKQKVFSWRDRFSVKDEQGNDRYFVEGEILSWCKKLHVYDMNGREVAFIREKVLSWLPRYFVEIEGQVVCEIVKELTFFKQKYRIEGIQWRLDGDVWAHEYCLYDNRRQVMQLSKKWFTWGDSYELNISQLQDELLCLCVALAVDCAIAKQSNR
ncbi:MAG: LURP-one-related family protein [Candidatus Bathyarchaeota archaeon]|nr:LURP-one-related family protein [Candidatus Termiticorpusculum sp.]